MNHDTAADALFKHHSKDALISLIDAGRELELRCGQTSAFISRDGSQKYCSIWIGEDEQAFDSVEELLSGAVIHGEHLADIWSGVELGTLF